MKIVTIATDLDHPFLNRLLAPSCRTAGLDLTILHVAKPSFEFAEKRAILTKYLPEVADPGELFVFTDAYDTLFLKGAKGIEQAYRAFPQRVVFSAELNSWPLGVLGLALYRGAPSGPFPYLNSGGFVGPAGDLLDLCTRYPEPPSGRFDLLRQLRAHGYDTDERFGFSDQYHWTLVQLLEPEQVGIDHRGDIFEYWGPRIPDVVLTVVFREFEEFRAQGRTSVSYRNERERLEGRLAEPSRAAQVHFASHISKLVMLDLLAEGRLPDWIMEVCTPGQDAPGSVEVRHL